MFMAKDKIIIIGTSGHAKVVIDVVEKEGKYEILGLIDPIRKAGEETLGYKILGDNSTIPELLKKNPDCKFFVAIGDNFIRGKVVQEILALFPEAAFITTIHPSAQIGKDVRIGNGVVIMAGAVINSSSTIGDFTIMYTKSSLDHDNILGKYASLAPNATTGGNVTIGDFSAIGISASIKHGVTMGSYCVLGGGSILLKNCEHNTLLYGVPAKKIRTRETGEKYL